MLPAAFTSDPDRLVPLEREAKILASLNHPSIGHIHGLEEADGQRALVLELIEGPILAERIKQGRIPQAAEELLLDLSRSYTIEDSPRDVEAACRFGGTGCLVRTGWAAEAGFVEEASASAVSEGCEARGALAASPTTVSEAPRPF